MEQCESCSKSVFSDGLCIDHWDSDKIKVDPNNQTEFDAYLDKVGRQEGYRIENGRCGSCGHRFKDDSERNYLQPNYCDSCMRRMNSWASGLLKQLPEAIKEQRLSIKTLEEFRQWVLDVYAGEYNIAGNPKHNNLALWTKEDFKKEFPQFQIVDLVLIFDDLISERKIKKEEAPVIWNWLENRTKGK